MKDHSHTVMGAFKTFEGASLAANRLGSAGFDNERICVLMSERAKDHLATLQRHTKAPEGMAAGGMAGGVLGAVAAGLTAVASVSIPGVGLLIAGPLAAALAGGGAGAAAGGVVGALIGFGVSEHEARLYKETLEGGGVVVAVTAPDADAAHRAREILREAGALHLEDERGRPIQL